MQIILIGIFKIFYRAQYLNSLYMLKTRKSLADYFLPIMFNTTELSAQVLALSFSTHVMLQHITSQAMAILTFFINGIHIKLIPLAFEQI